MQSFLLSPEELHFLKPMHIFTNTMIAEPTADINMFNQLSRAGVVLGSHIDILDGNVDVLIQNSLNEQIIRNFLVDLGCCDEKVHLFEQLFQIIGAKVNNMLEQKSDLVNFITTTERNRPPSQIEALEDRVEMLLVDIISRTVIDCFQLCREDDKAHNYIRQSINSTLLYENISNAFIKNIKLLSEDKLDLSNHMTDCLNAIEQLLQIPHINKRIEMSVGSFAVKNDDTKKSDLLKCIDSRETDILANICNVMQDEDINELCDSVQHLVAEEPALRQQIVLEIQNKSNALQNEDTIAEALQNCIITVIKNSINEEIHQNMQRADRTSILNAYLTDTMSLAKALGYECTTSLNNALNAFAQGSGHLELDQSSTELLQRVIVMHKLARNNELRRNSLELLRSDPYSVRNDAIFKQLLRCSGICTINLINDSKLKASSDVPLSLIYSRNQLAIEDFFIRKQLKPRGALLIVKDGFQAVVPKGSSRDILTGKCAYTVLDENGIRHFEPLHMFSALKLKNVTMFQHRFSTYSADEGDNKLNKVVGTDNIYNTGKVSTNQLFTCKSGAWPRKPPGKLVRNRQYPSNGVFFHEKPISYGQSLYF